MHAAVQAMLELDFPVLAADGGFVLGSSAAADALLSFPQGLEGASLAELLDVPAGALHDWLGKAKSGVQTRLCLPDGARSRNLMVRASPVRLEGHSEPIWLLGLHSRDSVSRQRVEREIMLRIGSVPISELMREIVPLTAEDPGRCPITCDMLDLVTRYIGADAALIFAEKGLPRLSLIGEVGLAPETLRAMLEYLRDNAHLAELKRGHLGEGVQAGLVFSFSDSGGHASGLDPLLRLFSQPPRETWLDGIGGFGAVLSIFNTPPDAELRTFATEAHVRLGRHLESAGYSRDLYSAYQDLQEAQERIIQTGRLAALGEIAAGIAHELRQPVTAINNFVSNIFSQVEARKFERLTDKLGEYRERSRRNVERLMGIIDHLRSFARDDGVRFMPVDPNRMLGEIRDTFFHEDRTLRRGIPVEWRIETGLPTVEMDAPRIEQVILNLVSNAGDAMEGRGNARIVVGAERLGSHIRMFVQDNGPGIPEEMRKRVFDPFFTTKPPGQGTGIGLSISHGIVKGHNGEILIENSPGGGATVVIFLPIEQPREGVQTLAPQRGLEPRQRDVDSAGRAGPTLAG